MKKIITLLVIIFVLNTPVYCACSITGGACAIEDINPKLKKQNSKKKSKTIKKQKKSLSIFKTSKQQKSGK